MWDALDLGLLCILEWAAADPRAFKCWVHHRLPSWSLNLLVLKPEWDEPSEHIHICI